MSQGGLLSVTGVQHCCRSQSIPWVFELVCSHPFLHYSPSLLTHQIEFGKNTASYLEIVFSITTAQNEIGQVSIEHWRPRELC
jgi:hypothetical protein